jgi:uncharacterized membrane protein (UPF0127 family)
MVNNRNIRVLLAFLILAAVFFPPGPAWGQEVSKFGNPWVWVTIGQVQVKAEVVRTPAKCFLGLSYRRSLPEGQGMLFLLPRLEPQVFCMRGMQFPIDIIWIADDKVAGMAQNISPEFKGELFSRVPVQTVLELPGGFADRYGIRQDDPVHWSNPRP